MSPPTTPAPVWPSQSDYNRPAVAPQRRFALTAAELAADYPAFDADDGDLPREKWARRHKTAVIASSIALVFALLSGGVITAGYAAGVASATPTVSEPTGTGRVTPTVLGDATAVRTCTVSAIASDPTLSRLHAVVSRAD
ncbi:MAG: hypothetical protein ABWY54_05410, partial [Glaciihabitans sp.]